MAWLFPEDLIVDRPFAGNGHGHQYAAFVRDVGAERQKEGGNTRLRHRIAVFVPKISQRRVAEAPWRVGNLDSRSHGVDELPCDLTRDGRVIDTGNRAPGMDVGMQYPQMRGIDCSLQHLHEIAVDERCADVAASVRDVEEGEVRERGHLVRWAQIDPHESAALTNGICGLPEAAAGR